MTDNLSPIKRALLAVEEMQSKLAVIEQARTEPIAVIGIGCRFPGGVDSPDSFWQLLEQGVDAITEVPADRWDIGQYYDPDPNTPGKTNTRWGGFLNNVDRFDADFFGISPREASWMDPQQRILLEVAWSALEAAGQVRERLVGSQTGVFIGACGTDYAILNMQDPEQIDAYSITGIAHSIIANRLSYLFDLRGPSMVIDTACSSSLVAIHSACQSLRQKECDMALAGGMNLILIPDGLVAFSRWGAMATDGRCKAFDARADGFVRGEGCGVVVLKRLSDALEAGDPILGLIRGSAINQDGRSTGLTAPNILAQQAVIRNALENARVTPAQISYIEAHGTGTSLGDPIELEALSAVYGTQRATDNVCAIGSVKTNIGHPEAAAGVAGLIKVLLTLHHEAIPPSLHFKTLNPNVSLDTTSLEIASDLCPWPTNTTERRYAAVSGFGFGGTNAHLIVEEAPAVAALRQNGQPIPEDQALILPISAAHPDALQTLAQNYQTYLASAQPAQLYDMCYTASLRRTHHTHRLTLVGKTPTELQERLDAFLHGETRPGLAMGVKPFTEQHRIVFVFPGQGSQWSGMGRQLFAQEPTFRQMIESCALALQPHMDWSLLDMFNAESPIALDRIDVIQPAIFAIQVALAALWQSWGVRPDAVIGHSMGEIAAAYVAGSLDLGDAARIIARRSRLLRRVSGQGAMAVVDLPFDEAQQCLAGFADQLSVAVCNSPHSTVLAGEPAALRAVIAKLEQRDIFCRSINVDVASHSPQMDALTDDLLAELQGVAPRAGTLPIYSTVLGRVIDGHECDARYWVQNLREPVLFAHGVQHWLEEGFSLFLELSPHPILLSAIEHSIQYLETPAVTLPSLLRGEDERTALLGTLGTLYTQGQPIAWQSLYPNGGRCTSLPTYPWQGDRYWIATSGVDRPHQHAPTPNGNQPQDGHPLLGHHLTSSIQPDMYFWETVLSLQALPYLGEHRVQGMIVLPTAAYIEMIVAASAEALGSSPIIEQIELLTAMVIPEQDERAVQIVITPESAGTFTVRISSRPNNTENTTASWTLHATASLWPAAPEQADLPARPLDDIQERCAESVDATDLYQAMTARGLDYGPHFRGLEQIWRRDSEALAQINLPTEMMADTRYQIHPVLLDICFQGMGLAVPQTGQPTESESTYLPTELECVQVHRQPVQGCWTHIMLRPQTAEDPDSITGDIALLDEQGQIVLEARGLRCKRVNQTSRLQLDSWLYQVQWSAAPLAMQHTDTTQHSLSAGGRWLIFADSRGIGQQVSRLLQEHGGSTVIVSAGSAFQQIAPDHYVINPQELTDFQQLLELAFDANADCCGVVHLWGLDAGTTENGTPETIADMQNLMCGSILHLVQALAHQEWHQPPRVWLVTGGAQAVDDVGSDIAFAQAPIWGLGRTISQEYPRLRCTRVDLSAAERSDELAGLLQELATDANEDEIALRETTRYVARLRPASLPAPSAVPIEFHSDRTYLITGGLGGLGLTIAQWMVEQGVRHLVLMSRSAPTATAQEAITAMEQSGAQIVVAQTDVAQAASVSRVLQQIEQTLPPLCGVMHMAGILDDGTLLQLTPERFQHVMAPKVTGAWNLHSLTLDQSLDFFVLFSSAAATLGAPGQGNYAAANAFLGALAHYRHARGLPALCVDWGLWSNVGAATRSGHEQRLESSGFIKMSPQQGVHALAYLLGQATPHIAVMPLDRTKMAAAYQHSTRPARLDDLLSVDGSPADDNPVRRGDMIRAAEPEERGRLMDTYLGDQIAQVMGFARSRLNMQQPITSLGLDSLMAVKLKNVIETELQVNLPVAKLYQGVSTAQLSSYLLAQLFDDRAEQEASAAAMKQKSHHRATVRQTSVEQRRQRRQRQETETI